MTNPYKTYVIALRHGFDTPDGWHDMLRRTEGVEIIGMMARRAQIRTAPSVALALSEKLGPAFMIEEATSRWT
ncbi:hypothetical protein [Rhizobium paknamense]|uniref:Uncharacterized protein n=1 Tax=Rhizobium paknamense TaxID=1206817 RepID=A0ABU0IBX9_9HYPH|nr:hypothetical protein [Rhizobium paknamense]MDQ0454749.1 hypothetical protein [Rhizobium paknamense]